MRDIYLSIFGDCASQLIAIKFKHKKAMGLMNWISLVQKNKNLVISSDIMKDLGITNYNQRIHQLDFNKNAFQYLFEEISDYLLIDLTDIRRYIFKISAPRGRMSHVVATTS